jgi:hypothetical protein
MCTNLQDFNKLIVQPRGVIANCCQISIIATKKGMKWNSLQLFICFAIVFLFRDKYGGHYATLSPHKTFSDAPASTPLNSL